LVGGRWSVVGGRWSVVVSVTLLVSLSIYGGGGGFNLAG
jgi:hypothetical protein